MHFAQLMCVRNRSLFSISDFYAKISNKAIKLNVYTARLSNNNDILGNNVAVSNNFTAILSDTPAILDNNDTALRYLTSILGNLKIIYVFLRCFIKNNV